MMHALRAGLGLARELLRGRGSTGRGAASTPASAPGRSSGGRRSAGLELERVGGIALTHEHGDHACGAARLARRLGVRCSLRRAPGSRLAPRMGTAEHRALGFSAAWSWDRSGSSACPTSHDAAEPLAVAVEAPTGPGSGWPTTWAGRPPRCATCSGSSRAIVLEANHDEVLLRTSGYPPVVQRRIAGSGGHLSNRAAAELLAELHHPGLGVVVLAHLSQRCNSADDARATVGPALRRVGFGGSCTSPIRTSRWRRSRSSLQEGRSSGWRFRRRVSGWLGIGIRRHRDRCPAAATAVRRGRR